MDGLIVPIHVFGLEEESTGCQVMRMNFLLVPKKFWSIAVHSVFVDRGAVVADIVARGACESAFTRGTGNGEVFEGDLAPSKNPHLSVWGPQLPVREVCQSCPQAKLLLQYGSLDVD